MLKINKLNSGYDSMQILRDIDMQIKRGEIIAIIGPNGAGKSTVLKSIFNLCNIYSGNIHFQDKNITKLATYKLISKGISYVPQGRQVFSDLTVRENLQMGGFIINDPKIIKQRMNSVFEKFPFLREKQNAYAFTLSGGQQQLLAIARALMQKPKILLLDEPSLGLAPLAMKQVFEKVLDINKEGISIIIVEQNAKQAVKIANRTYVLENGKIKLEGKKDVLQSPEIRHIYFGGM